MNRFKNVGTIMALVGMIGMLLIQFGVKVDIQWLDQTANLVCGILVLLGILNNPNTKGLDHPLKK